MDVAGKCEVQEKLVYVSYIGDAVLQVKAA